MPFIIMLVLVCLLVVSAVYFLWRDDDWPDDDHLEGPRGGVNA